MEDFAVKLHTVYFGEDFETVANAADGASRVICSLMTFGCTGREMLLESKHNYPLSGSFTPVKTGMAAKLGFALVRGLYRAIRYRPHIFVNDSVER